MEFKKTQLGKLEFIEQYLYEKPEADNYWRGISVDFKGQVFLSVGLSEGEHGNYSYRNKDVPLDWLRIDRRGITGDRLYTGECGNEVEYEIITQRYFKLEDIEACKAECVAIFDRYVKYFTE
jgi:hypothetical protein